MSGSVVVAPLPGGPEEALSVVPELTDDHKREIIAFCEALISRQRPSACSPASTRQKAG